MTAVEELSILEVTSDIDALYNRLHPDAKAIIPREAVVGWFTDAAPTLGASVAEPKKIRFSPWTWEVNGKTYRDSAEIAYTQTLANGSAIRDEIRLVKDHDGHWSWFFGRDRAFVEEQVARYGSSS